MAKRTFTLTADGDTLIRTIPRLPNNFFATIFCTGTFGSGTVTIKLSPDGGTTKVDAADAAGTVAFTAAGVKNLETGYGSNNSTDDGIKVYASLAGSTNPDINITVFDNQ